MGNTLIVSRKLQPCPRSDLRACLIKTYPVLGSVTETMACGKSSAGDSSNVNIEEKARTANCVPARGINNRQPALPRAGSFQPSDRSN